MTDYEIVWNGAHGGRDLDLFHPVDWLDPKTPAVALPAQRPQDRRPGRPKLFTPKFGKGVPRLSARVQAARRSA